MFIKIKFNILRKNVVNLLNNILYFLKFISNLFLMIKYFYNEVNTYK